MYMMAYFISVIVYSKGQDASAAFEACHHSEEAREMMQNFFVGQYIHVSCCAVVNLFLVDSL